MSAIAPELLAALEDAVHHDPGAASFAALAEAYRRSGRLEEAERVARTGLERKPDGREGRLVLALTLLDQGRPEKARVELERLAGHVLVAPESGTRSAAPRAREELSESELDDAFASAETDTDELIDPNKVAEQAVARVDAGASDGLDEGSDALEPGSHFATATMAQLLEAQGDERGARRIRSSLSDAASAPAAASGASREQKAGAPRDTQREQQVATLEHWLANLRGDRS